jgi:hypothetical protein
MSIEFRRSTVFLFLMALAGQAPIAMAQSSGTFTATGSMTTPRSEHTATLLLDGRVLIAGGNVASAELYDPTTGIFTATGSMTTARSLHTATLLRDGRVLIAGGGHGGNSLLSSAELYDPSTGTFTATGDMITAQAWHTAVLLGNGKVLIVGGYGTSSYPNIVPAELYDPATGTFGGTGAYAGNGGGVSDLFLPAILLADGKVLFIGQAQAQIYDPAGTFSLTGSASPCLSNAALLPNGKVLFAGGECVSREATATLYDPLTEAFPMTGKMAAPRAWHTLTPLPGGMVLAAGGETDSCAGNFCEFAGSTATAELYDPSTGAFSSTGSMTASRETHTATLLKDGRVLIAGGVSYGGIGIFGGATASAELYTPACSSVSGGAICTPDPWQKAITALKTAAGTDSYNFWQWDWLWQRTPSFPGAPSSFGLLGSIDNTPGLIEEIIAAGGGNGVQNISAEQWVAYYRQVIATDPWQQAIARMQASAGTDSYNFWQWAWFWQRSPAFAGAPAGFGVLGSIDNTPGLIDKIIAASGGNGLAVVSAEQWVQDYRQAAQ